MKTLRDIPLSLCVLFLLACIAACSMDRPDYVLSDKQMEDLLYDYHFARVLGENENASQRYKTTIYYLSAFEKHHTTEEQFDSTLAWYSKNPEAFNKVYQKVIKRIQDEKGQLERSMAISGQRGSVTQQGDSVNIWQGVPMFALTGEDYDNRVTFKIEPDNNFEEKDTIRLMAHVRYFDQNQRLNSTDAALIALCVRYRNDSIVSQVNQVLREGDYSLTIQSESLGAIREVYGFFYFPKQPVERMMLADRVALVRRHAKER